MKQFLPTSQSMGRERINDSSAQATEQLRRKITKIRIGGFKFEAQPLVEVWCSGSPLQEIPQRTLKRSTFPAQGFDSSKITCPERGDVVPKNWGSFKLE